ncbi:MAG: hypothetical protein AseanaTS_03770 [Candidatus Pelagadaptatus aseana]|uniref:hypothetical protein n=1 Tax=Candidatus Pelagadaptatus aseana TaxID=3120508 RepID=UPI0039B26F86
MRKILCTVNPEQVSDVHKKSLESALRSNYAKHLSESESLTIVWCELPTAQGFTSYEQPCVSLVVIEAQDDLDQDVRENMLSECAADWSEITGITLERLMISVFDETVFSEYMAANQRRLSLMGRIQFSRHMLVSLLRSKMTRGLLIFSPNVGS